MAKAKNVNNLEAQYTQLTSMNAKVYKPYVKVSFHTEKACYQTVAKAVNNYGEITDPNHTLVTISTQKMLSNPAGAFTVNLLGNEWAERIISNDMVVIQMGYLGEKTLTTVMVGLVDTVTSSRSAGSGTPSITTSVTGRDFGKVLIQSQLKFYPEIGANQSSKASKFFLTDVGWVSLMKFFTKDEIVKGTPAVIIDNIMRYLLPKLNDVKWKVYDERTKTPKQKSLTVMDVIAYQLAKIDFFLPMILTADQFEGSLWNLMERASIKPFCELFIDVRSASELTWSATSKYKLIPDTIEEASVLAKSKLKKTAGWYPSPSFQFGEDGARVVLALRSTPFDSAHKDKLVHHEINQVDVISEELSRTGEDHYNLFWAGTTVNPLGIDLKRVAPPLMNENNVKRYGISPLEVQIEGLEILQSAKSKHSTALEGMSKAYTAKLKAWFQNNHLLWNGSLVIRGRANIRIGHMANYRSQYGDREFYVEGVQQSFTVFEGWTTTLHLTRGQAISAKVDHTSHLPKPPQPKHAVVKKKPTPKDNYYTVKRGDTLWSIAGTYYKDTNKWRKIWEANKDTLIKRDKRNASDNGNWVYPGTILRVPK